MSFLRKLFRRDGQPPGPPSAPAAKPADGAEPWEKAGTEAMAEAARAHQDAPAIAISPDGTGATAPAAGLPAERQPREAGAEPAWWEETTPVPVPEQPAESAADLGTAPLGQETGARDAETADMDAGAQAPARASQSPAAQEPEEDGTRQLIAADVPALTALRSRRGFSAAALRDIGRVRSVNQDSVFALTSTLPRESSDVSMGLFIVADGMGGHSGGEIASRMAITTAVRYVLAELVIPALTDSVTEALQPLIIAAVQEANRAIWEHAQAIGSDMGTTCTVALLLGQALYIGHVGDSRAYLGTPTGLRLITNDHSTVGRLIQLGQLDPDEAREHPLRSQLYRTVGQHPDVLVDFIYQPIGDATHLLMCSDGLWSMLDEEVLLDVLEQTIWPQDACRELIARANLAGGEDNIGAVVVTLPAL